jgi:hypothetical protein
MGFAPHSTWVSLSTIKYIDALLQPPSSYHACWGTGTQWQRRRRDFLSGLGTRPEKPLDGLNTIRLAIQHGGTMRALC